MSYPSYDLCRHFFLGRSGYATCPKHLPMREIPKEGKKFIEPFIEDARLEEEAGSSEESPLWEAVDELELSQAKEELSHLIALNLKPIQKECIEWENHILHSANLSFFKESDVTKAYNWPYSNIRQSKQARGWGQVS